MAYMKHDIIIENIPTQFRERKQWVLWRYEAGADGRLNKIPINALTGANAKANDESTWCDFDTAVLRRKEDHGLGYEFSKDDPWVGIDLDGCRNPDTGEVAAWASEELAKLNSYSEVSPSLTGVKVWIVGKSPLDRGRKVQPEHLERICDKKPGVEVYEKGRFFAVTGKLLPGMPADPQPRQAELEDLCRRYFGEERKPQEAATKPAQSSGGIIVSAISAKERASKYVAKMEPAISGQGGHDRTYTVACRLVIGFNLSKDDALDVLREYNKGCKPEWSERELEHKVDDADKEPGERGYLLKAEAEPEEADNLIDLSSVRGSRQLILVAGQPEAKSLNGSGLKAVAMEGLTISASQIKDLETSGTKELLLAMNAEDTEKTVRKLSTSKLRPYVVDASPKLTDTAELLAESGTRGFRYCLEKAVRASSWLTSKLVHQQDITTAIGLDRAVSSVLEYMASIADGLDKREAEAALLQATGLTAEDLAVRKQAYERQASSQAAQATLKATVRQLQQKLDEGDITGAEEVLQGGLQEIRISRGVEGNQRIC